MDKFFKLTEKGTDVRTEVLAGLTTFFAMSYILFVNPAMLAQTGMPKQGVFLATIIGAVAGTLMMAFFANLPYAQAPGMGLNAFFTFTVVFALGYTWQEALAMVFICGIISLIITLTKVRKMIIESIPGSLRAAISAGIGVFLAYVGIKNAGLLKFSIDPGNYTVAGKGADKAAAVITANSAATPGLVDFNNPAVIVALVGLAITIFFIVKNIKGGVILSILVTTVVAILVGLVDLSAIEGVKVDKHSTGGVGDKVTLILAPLVASFGVPVAKMSGRGLGHTGGTIDKLESIKGYQVERSQENFIRQVQDIGVSVIGQSDQLVKADKLLYALRDVTATVDTIPLIASSVMSKKIAAGADAILLDVTVGEGAFMKTVGEARELAQTMVDLGKAVGRKTVAVITDMSQPLGRAIGNRLEILEAIEILQGKGREDISHFICELAQIMLGLADVEKTIKEIRQHLENGQALAKFEEMVAAQGGDLEDLYRPVKVAHVVEIPAQETGVISALPAMEFGLYAMRLGAGRAVKSDDLDYETGIVFEKKVGDSVQKGEIVAKVYTNGKISSELVTEFQKYVKINDGVQSLREIIEIIS